MTTLFSSPDPSMHNGFLQDLLLEAEENLGQIEEADNSKNEDLENYLPASLRTTTAWGNNDFNTVEAIAPSPMPGGYQFTVEHFGHSMVVEVPSGGVDESELFLASIVKSDYIMEDDFLNEKRSGHSVPTGSWRDGICDCFAHGFCHASVCLACWCSPLALGQILTRLRLDGLGRPSKHASSKYWSAFGVLAILFLTFIVLENVLSAVAIPKIDAARTKTYEANGISQIQAVVPGWIIFVLLVRSILRISFFLYIILLTAKTRSYIRQRYQIQGAHCIAYGDCCTSLWCHCCSIAQMSRHTADYRSSASACFSPTGLPHCAPRVIPKY